MGASEDTPDRAGNGDPAPLRRWETPVVWALFLLLAYFPLFLNLDALPLREWDESRQAMSAYEMMKGHDFLVAHYDGRPDMWSTKPPLLLWCQTALFMLLGPGELALRLPAALSALFTGMLLLFAAIRWLGRPWLGLIGALVLYTAQGYVTLHVSRTGDYDAPLTLFLVAQLLCIFRFERTGSPRAINWFFAALALAALTKGVQALLFLPGIGIYLLTTRSAGRFLRHRRTWIGLGLLVLVVGGFYLGREAANPDYLHAVWENELGGRYGSSLEGHERPWNFFLLRMMAFNFSYFYLLVPCGVVAGLCIRDIGLRRWTGLLTLCAAGYLAVISTAGTKCEWYDAPLYPLLGAICAVPLHLVFTWLRRGDLFRPDLRADPTPYLGLFLAFALPYANIVGHIHEGDEWPWDVEHYRIMHRLQAATRGRHTLQANVLCYDGNNAPLLFYAHLLSEQGKPLTSVSKHQLTPGMRAMASENDVKAFIESHYRYELLEDDHGVRVYHLTGPSNDRP